MPSNTATAAARPPTVHQPGNASVMSFDDMREELFDAVDRCGGVITRACRELGLPFNTVHRERIRDAAFAAELALRIETARANRAVEMMALADEHVRSHLRGSLVPLLDDDRRPLLDDDFEPVMVSSVPLRSVIEARREYRQQVDGGDGPTVAIQNNQTVLAEVPDAAPRLVRPAPSADVEIGDIETFTEETCDG